MILYKLDNLGKLRFLQIITYGATLIQNSGIVNGKIVSHSKEATEKNVGKINHQTAIKNAVSMKNSLIKEKLRKGYFKTKEEAESIVLIKPTLAKNYKDYRDKIDFQTCYIQPKLDGMRCLAELDGQGGVQLKSRTNKEIDTVPHIVESLSNYRGMPIILDGELYAHGLDFQTNMKLVKKNREETVQIKFHVYDTIDEQPFWVRIKRTGFYSENVLETLTEIVKSFEDIKDNHSQYIELGYEGSIIRWGKQGYQMKRTDKLLKNKDFIDITAKVINIEPQVANPLMGTLVCEGLEGVVIGKTFKASLKGTHEERIDLLTNKSNYIGKTVEIRFFEYSQDGIPRFPVAHGFRLDK